MKDIYDLKANSGLGITFNAITYSLNFESGLTAPKPALRTMDEMREVLMDTNLITPQDLYYMYRDVHAVNDEPLLKQYNLRYDVTVIRPEKLGKELMKTAGHYHPYDFGELYEVVFGECFCMMQKPDREDPSLIEEVIVVKAKAGQKIAIPPHFGHILVNPGPNALITSNWVSSRFSSDYSLYKKAGGAAYFITEENGKVEFIPNKYFKALPEIEFRVPASRIDKFGLAEGSPIYPIIKQDAKKLDFLNRPLDFSYEDVFIK